MAQTGKYDTLETRKDGTKFTSKTLRQAAAHLQSLAGQYDSRQSHLVEQVRGRSCPAHTAVTCD